MLKWVVAPIVGAVIGYITNDLAIRMLFHPRRAVYIGKFHVPFTPGLIPAQKSRIAQSIGSVVSQQLLNEETLRQTMLSEDAVKALQSKVRQLVRSLEHDERTVNELLLQRFDAQTIQEKSEAVETSLTVAACLRLDEAKVGQIVVESVAGPMMDNIAQNKLLAMLMDAKAQSALKAKMASKVDELIAEKAPEVIFQLLDDTRKDMQNRKISELYDQFRDKEDLLIERGTDLYVSLLGDNLGKLLKAVNIEKIVVDKIDGFDAAQLEEMIFGIMKRELNAIVYLGAGLGFLMGFVNALF